jgi:hypothetical protein
VTASAAISNAPSPVQVDELALQHNELKEKIENILAKAKEDTKDSAEELVKLVGELRVLVDQFGSAHAKKSKLLNGIDWEMMLTKTSTTSLNGASVERMKAWAGTDKRKLAVFDSLFVGTMRWDLTPTATALIQSPTIPLGAKRLFSACLKIEPNTPRFEVRPKKAAEKLA